MHFNYSSFSRWLDLYIDFYDSYLDSLDGKQDKYFFLQKVYTDFLNSWESCFFVEFMINWYSERGLDCNLHIYNDEELALFKFHRMFISAWLAYNDENIFDDFEELLSIVSVYQCTYPSLRLVFDYYASYICDKFLEVKHG